MADKEGAEKACANPNPMIDGRKANVNLAYLGAKPKLHASQPGKLPPGHGGEALANFQCLSSKVDSSIKTHAVFSC